MLALHLRQLELLHQLAPRNMRHRIVVIKVKFAVCIWIHCDISPGCIALDLLPDARIHAPAAQLAFIKDRIAQRLPIDLSVCLRVVGLRSPAHPSDRYIIADSRRAPYIRHQLAAAVAFDVPRLLSRPLPHLIQFAAARLPG